MFYPYAAPFFFKSCCIFQFPLITGVGLDGAHWLALRAIPKTRNTPQEQQQISRELAEQKHCWHLSSICEFGLTIFPELTLLLWGLMEHVEDVYYHYIPNISHCWGFFGILVLGFFLNLIILDSFPKLICHNLKKCFLWILLAWSFSMSQQNSEHCCLMIRHDNSQYLFRI